MILIFCGVLWFSSDEKLCCLIETKEVFYMLKNELINSNQKDCESVVGGFLRLKQVLMLIPISRSSWWAGVAEGKYPRPIKLGQRVTVWRVSDIQKLIKKFEDENV